jgi:predicted GIY-YIG superfamily endonuclease
MRTTANQRSADLAALRALPGIPALRGFYVYFLWDGDELVYVGSTFALLGRLGDHERQGKKVFNRATYYAYADRRDMLCAEALYAVRYRPRYNKQCKHMRYVSKPMPAPKTSIA